MLSPRAPYAVTAIAAITASMIGGPRANATTTTIFSGQNSAGDSLVTAGTAATGTSLSYRSGLSGAFGLLPTTSNSKVLGPAASGQHPYAADPTPLLYHAPISGSEWISPYIYKNGLLKNLPVGTILSPGFLTPRGQYLYSTAFTLGAGQTQFTLNGSFLADGFVSGAYLDYGTAYQQELDFQNGLLPALNRGQFSGTGVYGSGTHTLDFIVTNLARGTQTALDFRGTAVPEPGTVTAYAAAAFGLGVFGFRARRRQLARQAS